MLAASPEKPGQFELSLFMDISQFDELERRVTALIDQQEQMRADKDELQSRVADLENQIELKTEENDRLMAQRDDLLGKQRDFPKEDLIRRKITDLLQKLEGL